MNIITIHVKPGHFGHHATCYERQRAWSTSTIDQRTAAYRCALNVFYGIESKQGRPFQHCISVFVLEQEPNVFVAVQLNPEVMCAECWQTLAEFQKQQEKDAREIAASLLPEARKSTEAMIERYKERTKRKARYARR